MKRFFTWKVLRRLLISFAVLITLVAVVWAVENFRGNRAWAEYKAELEAKGEKLDLQSMVPPPVPDEKNFAMAPFFTNLNFEATPDHSGLSQEAEGDLLKRDLSRIGFAKVDDQNRTTPTDNETIDLASWQNFYRGNTNYPQPQKAQTATEDVLVALSRFDEELNSLHQAAAERPLTRFPIHYEDGMRMLLPHLNAMRKIASVLRLRSTAYLELDRSDEAFRDAQLAFRLTDSVKDEPLLISFMVRIALLRVDTAFVKEGIFRHAWSEEQLKQLQDHFAQADVLSDYHKAMRGERTFANDLLEAMGRGEYSFNELVNPGQVTESSGGWVLPNGWLKQNQRYMAKMHQDITLPAVDTKARRVYPEIVARAEAKGKAGFIHPYNMFGPMLLPAVLGVSKRTAQQQTDVDQAMLACALERYYLTHNQTYPDSLQDLVPQFITSLPNDVISGAPLKYQRMSNGFYRIYSTGWNGKDDGGKSAPRGSNKDTDTDWVWQFSEN